jgi:RHS repeat-associated protein
MTPGNGTAKDYGFDASGDLTTLPTGASGTYNDAGDLTSSTMSGTTTNYAYNADGQQLSSAQGSTTESSGTWNGAGELTAYNDAADGMTAAEYNGNGLRSSDTIGGVTSAFTWQTEGSLPKVIMDGANAYIYGNYIAPAEQVSLTTGAISYLITDSLGSVRGVIGSTGTLAGTASYDAWGNPEANGGLTATTPFGFAGNYTDATGLEYLDNRYYSPAQGQFESVDSELALTLQPYLYASGDPVGRIDPSGTWPRTQHEDGCTITTQNVYLRKSSGYKGVGFKPSVTCNKQAQSISIYGAMMRPGCAGLCSHTFWHNSETKNWTYRYERLDISYRCTSSAETEIWAEADATVTLAECLENGSNVIYMPTVGTPHADLKCGTGS